MMLARSSTFCTLDMVECVVAICVSCSSCPRRFLASSATVKVTTPGSALSAVALQYEETSAMPSLRVRPQCR